MLLAIAVLLALFLINCWTMLLFWLDKQRARSGEWRISEASLLGLAMIGGTPGAFFARSVFRHKTRKEPFSTHLFVILAIQAGAAAGFLFF
jgi:uncharacterized membrane protein YsdA (DUF1294 family)